MKSMYDGYHFCEFAKGVFNPFSVLNVFDGYKFDNYWFQTGTPTFLVHILQKQNMICVLCSMALKPLLPYFRISGGFQ